MSLSDKITMLRKSRALSQEELAQRLGVSRQAVSKWESGQSLPDIDKIVLLSEFFGVTTDYLLKDTNDNVSEEKEESEEKEGNQSENEEKQTIKSYDGEDPNKQAELTGTITTARVLDEELIIRIEIDQFLISGTCELTLTKGEKKYSEKTNILADASTSTCEGFNVPINNLEGGVWKIEIRVFSGEKTGEIKGEANI